MNYERSVCGAEHLYEINELEEVSQRLMPNNPIMQVSPCGKILTFRIGTAMFRSMRKNWIVKVFDVEFVEPSFKRVCTGIMFEINTVRDLCEEVL
jgi:hypothetical protein